MFGYLRYFAIISFLLICIVAGLLGVYFRTSAAEDMRDQIVKNNTVLVQSFENNEWNRSAIVSMFKEFRRQRISEGNWIRYKGYSEAMRIFTRKVFLFFKEMPMVQVNLYTPSGVRIFSMSPAGVLQGNRQGVKFLDGNTPRRLIEQAMQGQEGSLLVNDAEFYASGDKKNGSIVQAVVPLMKEGFSPLVVNNKAADNVEGIVEIFYDVSTQWGQLSSFQYLGTGTIIATFLVLIGTLMIISSRAEAIIARQHDTNLELAAQAAAAEAENQNKSQFLANISHELRTPLNAIIGFSEIIKNEVLGALGNTQYTDYIRDIHGAGVHLLGLINDILDYSKAEAGKLDLQLEEVDVTKTISNSLRLVAPRAEELEVRLISNVPKEHYIIVTDAKKLKQVMLNLLSNAIKFTPAGGEVKVSLWQNVVEGSLSIEVKDTGIGIAQKDISRALAPFGQVDSTLSRKYEGTGLGLPLTKKFIEIMGGVFSIHSEENVGTVISFTLPNGGKK